MFTNDDIRYCPVDYATKWNHVWIMRQITKEMFILGCNEAWSYKSKSKQTLGQNIFDEVDEISHSHFFFCDILKVVTFHRNLNFFIKQKVKGNYVHIVKLLKYWKKTWRLAII